MRPDMRPDVLDTEAEAGKLEDEKPVLVKRRNSLGNFYQKLAARRNSFKSNKALAADAPDADVPPISSSISEYEYA